VIRKYAAIQTLSSQTQVCSVQARQPSRSSARKFGVAAARARAGRLIPNSSSALTAYVPASTSKAVPGPMVATMAPPVAAPSGKER
jgi:hypothetical protein